MTKKRNSNVKSHVTPKHRILEAAQRLFYQEGVRSTGIDRIIAEAGVTKVTFYRQFRSKDKLIEAFLESRHATWIAAFREMLEKYREAQSSHERRTSPLTPVLHAAHEIIHASTFRGCAFANTVAEVGPSLPSVLGIAARHKGEVCEAIAALLPAHKDAGEIAWAATLALDGAIVNAQTGGQSAANAMAGFQTILRTLSRAMKR